ncbi:MAG: hypothetical protein ACOYES_11910 [Bacillota bacterium]
MIRYVDSLDGIRLDMLHGFFEGWRRSVSPEEHLELLRGSDHVVLAVDDGLNVVSDLDS